jgi:chemotaxis-related protein WspB
MLMLMFRLGDGRYALPTRDVVEVTPRVQLEPVAGAPGYVSGLFNYRGEHVPVIDLCSVIRNRACEDCFTTRIILVDYPLSNGHRRVLGLLAEQVTETLDIDPGVFSSTGVQMTDTPFLGDAANTDAGLVQRVSVPDLLPGHVQSLLFPAETG